MKKLPDICRTFAINRCVGYATEVQPELEQSFFPLRCLFEEKSLVVQ